MYKSIDKDSVVAAIVTFIVTVVAILAAFIALSLFSGCAQLPSVGACRIAEYKRSGDMWSAKLDDCRVIQSGGAAGVVGAAIPGL